MHPVLELSIFTLNNIWIVRTDDNNAISSGEIAVPLFCKEKSTAITLNHPLVVGVWMHRDQQKLHNSSLSCIKRDDLLQQL